MHALRRAVKGRNLLSFLASGRAGCLGGLRRLGLGQPLLEFIHAPGGIDEFLRPGIKRVAGIANTDNNDGLRRACLNDIPAGATNFRLLIFRMNLRFHKLKGRKGINGICPDKPEPQALRAKQNLKIARNPASANFANRSPIERLPLQPAGAVMWNWLATFKSTQIWRASTEIFVHSGDHHACVHGFPSRF